MKTGTGYEKKACLVVFNTNKLFRSPKYKMPTDTRYNRDKAPKPVKKFLSSLEQSKNQREKVLDEEYHLSYLIQLPKGKHCYHNTGKAAGIAELLDPRVTNFVKESSQRIRITSNGFCYRRFVRRCSPDHYDGRFYPERRKIRNLITYVKMETV